MRMLIVLTVLLGLAAPVLAVESRSLPSSAVPGYLAGPQAPLVSSPTVGAPVVPLPPHLPARLPSGGVNLDEAWIQDGGARLYWNTLVIPRQLRMGGASFVDPAAVPELLPVDSDKVVRPARRRVPARAVTSAEKQKPGQRTAPAGAGSTTLKLPAAAAPAAKKGASPTPSPEADKPVVSKQAAPYSGPAPAVAVPPVPLPIMPADPVAPKAPATPR